MMRFFYLFIFSSTLGYHSVMISEIIYIDKKLIIVYIISCLLCLSYNTNSIIIKPYDLREQLIIMYDLGTWKVFRDETYNLWIDYEYI